MHLTPNNSQYCWAGYEFLINALPLIRKNTSFIQRRCLVQDFSSPPPPAAAQRAPWCGVMPTNDVNEASGMRFSQLLNETWRKGCEFVATFFGMKCHQQKLGT